MPADGLPNTQKRRNREAADWIIRNANPNQSSKERARFQLWLDGDPENCRTYSAAERLMSGDARRAIESDPALADIKLSPSGSGKAITATIILATILTGTFFALDGPMRLQADVLAGTGETPVIRLEDGSEVHLNASSAIAMDFTENRRTVHLLRGEAFFKVAHAPQRPFVVEAGSVSVTALGTAFDVRYGDDDTEVTVTENAVQMDFKDDGIAATRISQGEQAIYDYRKKAIALSEVDEFVALAWRRGHIAVDGVPLSHVVEEINRHFSGRIVIVGSALADRRVSGTIRVVDVDEALSFLRNVLGVKTTRLGPVIVVRK